MQDFLKPFVFSFRHFFTNSDSSSAGGGGGGGVGTWGGSVGLRRGPIQVSLNMTLHVHLRLWTFWPRDLKSESEIDFDPSKARPERSACDRASVVFTRPICASHAVLATSGLLAVLAFAGLLAVVAPANPTFDLGVQLS